MLLRLVVLVDEPIAPLMSCKCVEAEAVLGKPSRNLDEHALVKLR